MFGHAQKSSGLLFATHDLSASLQSTVAAVQKEVDALEANRLLNTASADLRDYFVQKYRVEAITLFRDGWDADVQEVSHHQRSPEYALKATGYPHLDLGDFARQPHTKHLCGNCGRDNTRSKGPIASTPLKPLHDQFSKANNYVDDIKAIDLDDYAGLPFQVWASTPAVLWTAERPQERRNHVHVYKDGDYLIDDTFGSTTRARRSTEESSFRPW